jgi:uncharacterized protein YlxW (UPF0749 family)
MKKEYVSIILVSTILGIFIGFIFKEHIKKLENYDNKDYIKRKEIIQTNKSIKSLSKEKENLEDEYETLKKENESSWNIEAINSKKEELSYTDLNGKGVIIKIDAVSEEIGNIANFVDYNKILIKIVNDLKQHGGEYISINEQRLNQYSEITLAGNHININSNAIAPPYEIKCIGEKISKDYINDLNKYVENLQNNYPLKIEIIESDNIELSKISIPDKLRYIKGE